MCEIIVSGKADIRIKTKCCAENQKRSVSDGYSIATCDICGGVYFKYYSAKATICCSCREKKRLLNHGSAVEKKPGYPKEPGYFKTYDEIQEYYSSDELTCLLCGNGFVCLPAHLSAIHDISADGYKEMFGLPLSRGLSTSEFSEERSNECKRLGVGRSKEAMVEMQKVPKSKPRKMNGVLREHTNSALSSAVKANPNHIVNRKNIVVAFCSRCGSKVERDITEHALLVQGCKILCGKCKREGSLASQRRYRRKRSSKGQGRQPS